MTSPGDRARVAPGQFPGHAFNGRKNPPTCHPIEKEFEVLVLMRRVGEEIRIGDDIVIKVTEIRGGKVRVGIEAPRDLPVTRSEQTSRDSPNVAGQRPADISAAA